MTVVKLHLWNQLPFNRAYASILKKLCEALFLTLPPYCSTQVPGPLRPFLELREGIAGLDMRRPRHRGVGHHYHHAHVPGYPGG